MTTPRIGLLPQVASAHLVSHLHIMVLPALLPLLPAAMDVGFVELGLAIALFNIVSALVQAPLGFAVDRFGARRVLVAGLLLGSTAYVSMAIVPGYAWLLVAMVLAGLANGVYHPADYALLAQGIDSQRMGRAFSVHTFAGFLGGAIAPALLLGIAALSSTRWAFAAAGLLGFAAVAILWIGGPTPRVASAPSAAAPATGAPKAARALSVFTPAVMVLTLLYVLLNLSTGAIEKFSVSALTQGWAVPLTWANAALTAFLFTSAFGVLAGGFVADRTTRHGLVAAGAFFGAGVLVATVALNDLPPLVLVPVMAVAGFLTGLITPSRDMLVRAAAPAGAEGKVFGIVSTGFNIGGVIGPILFGWLLDHGRPLGILWASVTFMALTISLTLLQDHVLGRRRAMRLRSA